MASKQKESTTIKNVLRPIVNHRIRIVRLIVQIIMFTLLNGLMFGLSRTQFLLPIQFPTGGPFTTVWSAFDALQYTISIFMVPYLAISIFALFGAVVGKTTCGWVCPFGLFQDLFIYMPTKKKKVSKPTNKGMKNFAWTFVIISVIVSIIVGVSFNRAGESAKEAFGIWKDMPFSVFDPSSTLFASIFYYLRWGIQSATFGAELGEWKFIFWFRLFLFLITLILITIFPRAYCRWFCPTGALLGIFSRFSLIGLKRNPNRCPSGCDECERACPTQVPILSYGKEVADSACINCGECIDACPEKALKITLRI